MTETTAAADARGSYVALCGGVGGAKLALGLARVIAPDRLTVVVNTGDDFEHVGFHVSPDVDTVLYTLAGIANPEQGWGLAGETWSFMAALERIGGPAWFKLGDQDIATHATRTERLRRGETLSAVTDHLRKSLGVAEPAKGSKQAKKPRKVASGQKEMLMPIAGKKPAKEAAVKKPAAKPQRKSA